MKEFPSQQIEGRKKIFEKENFLVEESQLGELNVSYFVIPQELNPSLQDFALRMTTTNPKTKEVTGIFGVSDSVPAELRPYWAAHEIIEFTQIGINQEGRCAAAEERIIELLPEDLKQEYVNRRIPFFENLIIFFMDDIASENGNYTDDDLLEAQATLEYLKNL